MTGGKGGHRNRNGRQGGTARSASRLAAVQALYELEMSDQSVDQILTDLVRRRWDQLPIIDDEDRNGAEIVRPETALLTAIVRGAAKKIDKLDEMIQGALPANWPLARIEILLKCVLRAGVFELIDRSDVPPKVVISEYVEIAHAFFDHGEAAMVNGILDRLGHILRATELDPPAG